MINHAEAIVVSHSLVYCTSVAFNLACLKTVAECSCMASYLLYFKAREVLS